MPAQTEEPAADIKTYGTESKIWLQNKCNYNRAAKISRRNHLPQQEKFVIVKM